MRIEALAPGLLTTVQDRGRRGHAGVGVGLAGAADGFSHAVANLLVGNPSAAATLEITLSGPTLRFHGAARIAICGADIDARTDGQALPGWRPVDLPAGSELKLGGCRRGCRAYLAIAGGIQASPVLGSRSTDLRGGFGGLDGRALRTGDELRSGPADRLEIARVRIANWWIDPHPDIDFDTPPVVDVLPGHHDVDPPQRLFEADWRIAPASDRQGLRLDGPVLTLRAYPPLPSEPVLPGTVQLPPDGQPIILLADAQTVGGYPRIGHVARSDLPRLAQLRPGDHLRLRRASAETALARLDGQHQRLARIRLAVEARRAR